MPSAPDREHLAAIDPEGFVQLADRVTEVIKSGAG